MDAGVPISAPVAGIAMGLITGEDGKHAVLTDIQGAEDHTGDMDFKVAGTAEGVTALQMDIKVKGIDFKIMEQALEQARTARLKILDHLNETIDQPREDLSEFAPRMVTFKVPTDKIGAIIGPGGSVIRGMIEEFGVDDRRLGRRHRRDRIARSAKCRQDERADRPAYARSGSRRHL